MDINIAPPGKLPAHRPERIEVTEEQIRYVQLKLTTKLSQRDIAKQLGVHYNTLTNWNKSKYVQEQIAEQLEAIRKDNMIGMQRLMSSLIRESTDLLDNEEIGSSIKIQLIGQLFSQAGKFSGLEPPKQVQKKIEVTKTFEQMIDCGIVDVESE